jgi:hypothetical protein
VTISVAEHIIQRTQSYSVNRVREWDLMFYLATASGSDNLKASTVSRNVQVTGVLLPTLAGVMTALRLANPNCAVSALADSCHDGVWQVIASSQSVTPTP